METLRKNPKEVLEIPISIVDVKNAHERLISGLAIFEKRINGLEDRSTETSQTEHLKRKQSGNKQTKILNTQKLWNNAKRCNIYIIGIPKEKRNI